MNNKHRKRKPTSFSLSANTIARLEQYAKEHHTNKSQAVTDLIWAACPWSTYRPTKEDLDFAESARYEVIGVDDEGNVLLSDCPWEWEER